MLFDILKAETVFGLNVDESAQQIFVLRRHFAIDEVESALDLGVQDRGVVILEGKLGHHHCEKDDTQGPDIGLFRIIQFTSDHFRRSIAGRSASCGQLFFGLVHV